MALVGTDLNYHNTGLPRHQSYTADKHTVALQKGTESLVKGMLKMGGRILNEQEWETTRSRLRGMCNEM